MIHRQADGFLTVDAEDVEGATEKELQPGNHQSGNYVVKKRNGCQNSGIKICQKSTFAVSPSSCTAGFCRVKERVILCLVT